MSLFVASQSLGAALSSSFCFLSLCRAEVALEISISSWSWLFPTSSQVLYLSSKSSSVFDSTNLPHRFNHKLWCLARLTHGSLVIHGRSFPHRLTVIFFVTVFPSCIDRHHGLFFSSRHTLPPCHLSPLRLYSVSHSAVVTPSPHLDFSEIEATKNVVAKPHFLSLTSVASLSC